jgi:hypothetical protein
MSDSDSLSDRLNKRAQQQEKEIQAEARVRMTQQEIVKLLCESSHPEFDRLFNVLEERVSAVNPKLSGLPLFEVLSGQHCIKQGNVAAYLSFHQLYSNAPPISLMLSYGREPVGMYAGFSPEPVRYKMEPEISETDGKIVWTGDLGELSSEMLADFVLEHLTDYYLNQKEIIERRRTSRHQR